MKYFLCVLGLVLVLEGLPYAAFPHKIKDWLRLVLELPEASLRKYGLMAMIAGVFLVWLGRS